MSKGRVAPSIPYKPFLLAELRDPANLRHPPGHYRRARGAVVKEVRPSSQTGLRRGAIISERNTCAGCCAIREIDFSATS